MDKKCCKHQLICFSITHGIRWKRFSIQQLVSKKFLKNPKTLSFYGRPEALIFLPVVLVDCFDISNLLDNICIVNETISTLFRLFKQIFHSLCRLLNSELGYFKELCQLMKKSLVLSQIPLQKFRNKISISIKMCIFP